MWELIRESLASLRGNILRTILTMVGVILGVGAVVSIMSMGTSAYTTVSDTFINSGFGSLSLYNIKSSAPDLDSGTISFLQSQNIDGISDFEPQLSISTTATDRFSNEFDITLVGARENTLAKSSLELLVGSFISESDGAARSQVAVIDNKVANKFFFSPEEALGQKLRFGGKSYKIIGVFKTDTPLGKTRGVAYIPFSTLLNHDPENNGFNEISILTTETADVEGVQTQVKNALMQQRGFTNEDHLDFMVTNPRGQLKSIQQFFTVFSVFMSLIAAISLLVGGVGIMNIMLVSVTERTKEIGLLKALGAQKGDIVFQFLVESVVLTVFGGLLGVALGIGVSLLAIQIINMIDLLPEFTYAINFVSILVSMVVAVAIGLIFGAYPAKKAADLDPVEALRRE